MAKQGLLSEFRFEIDPKNCGGESFSITTEFYGNGDPGGVFINQRIGLQSYSNSAEFLLCGTTLTSDVLRKLADQIDAEMIKAKAKTFE